MKEKVMLGMSGGVDSAVSAHILKTLGYEPTGINCCFLSTLAGREFEESSKNNLSDAEAVCRKLGIEFISADMGKEFEEKVIRSFAETYEKGGTPNPCIECNRFLKFGEMLSFALEKDFNCIATGHYAQIEKDASTGRFLLKKGIDSEKDQSYVLYCLNQHQLSHTLFPLGDKTKAEVRQLAAELSLISANRKDSQDICFVPDGNYAAFIEAYLNKSFPEGDFVNEEGKILGTHKGIIHYTVGQRRGLGLALPAPLYVKEKNTEKNRVILCENQNLFSKSLDAESINLIPCDTLKSPIRVKAKVRYKHREQWATVTQTDKDRLHVEFDEPQRAISKGQSLVLYDGDIVVGGGIII